MKIVKPSVELLWCTIDPEIQIEKAGRVCYKSEDKITEDSAGKFVKALRKAGHHAMLEHACASFRIITDRGITHEIVRHRIASFAQECVSGDTLVRKDKTIKQLFDRSFSPQGKTHNKTISLRSCDERGNIIRNKIQSVFYKGIAPVYEVHASLGYRIKATANHEFQLPNGSFISLNKLSIGDSIMVNGRPCLLKIPDDELKHLYLQQKQSPQEIASTFSAPYSSVLRRLKALGIFVKRMNDKNKEKYTKNHTAFSIEKMRQTILEQYNNGRVVWNKGIKEEENPSVRSQADSLRRNHHNNLYGDKNSNWKGGVSRRIALRKKEEVAHCELCGCIEKLEVRHIDGNDKNNQKENLLKLCINCHKKIHRGWYIGKKAHPDTITKITAVGKEPVYDLEMKAPHHNYVANGFIVHNSTRWCNYSKDKFGNECTFIQPPNLTYEQTVEWRIACVNAEDAYFSLLDKGCSPQIARSVLPNCLKTEIVMTANLREWRHFIKLRGSKEAHPQIRPIAFTIWDTLMDIIPNMFEDLTPLSK